jgi:hypothetical protein
MKLSFCFIIVIFLSVANDLCLAQYCNVAPVPNTVNGTIANQKVGGVGFTSDPLWPTVGGIAVKPLDLWHLHDDFQGASCFSAGPAYRVSIDSVTPWGTNPFGQFSIAWGAGNCGLAQKGDVILRSACSAHDLILTNQNTSGKIRFLTTPSAPTGNCITNFNEKERVAILNNGNVGIGNENISYVANNANFISGGSTTPLPIKSQLQVGSISIQPARWGTRGNSGGIAFNSWFDSTADTYGLNKRLNVGPVSGIGFEAWHASSSSQNDGTTHGSSADGSISLFAIPNGPADSTFIKGAGLNLRPDKLFLNIWNSDSTSPHYANHWIELFDYTFPTWNTARSSVNDDGQFYIKDRVFIGTSNFADNHPPFSPTGFYELSVNGSILSKEIVVDAHASWSDFVFSADYKLKPLNEVELYIKKNNHLPDIPTAKEVEENGQNLGAIQSKLLQKIEELTLYVIDLRKENIDLRERLENLESNSK